MRIGVLTFHKSINNGAVMQCFSLAKRLKQEFCEDSVEVIDYHMPKIEKAYTPSLKNYVSGGSLLLKIKKLVRLMQHPYTLIWQKKRAQVFKSVENNLPLSNRYIFQDEPTQLFSYINDNYDVVIVGSDAVWNYVKRGFPNPYFLDTSVNCRKMTYAASCYGMNYEKIPKKQQIAIKEILDDYCFLGTRDDESEKFLEYVGSSKPANHTCDPTVFLDIDDLPIDVDYLVEKLRKKGYDFSKKTIGVMGTDKMCRMIRKLYGSSVQIVALYNYNKDADVNLYDLTPYEWAYVFRYFNATITTYFHGTQLSLRNGVPVACIALETEYSKTHTTKVLDFLERIGFKEWYIHTDYRTKNILQIKQLLDCFINNDLKKDILMRIEEEGKSFETFLEALRKIKEENVEIKK